MKLNTRKKLNIALLEAALVDLEKANDKVSDVGWERSLILSKARINIMDAMDLIDSSIELLGQGESL